MTNEQLFLSISELLSENTKALEYHMDTMEESLNNKIDGVEAKLSNRIDSVEARLGNRMDSLENRIDEVEKSLKSEIRMINLKLENIIEPRLQNIEACYISTFERYKVSVEKMGKMELDIEVLKSVVRKHDEILCMQTA